MRLAPPSNSAIQTGQVFLYSRRSDASCLPASAPGAPVVSILRRNLQASPLTDQGGCDDSANYTLGLRHLARSLERAIVGLFPNAVNIGRVAALVKVGLGMRLGLFGLWAGLALRQAGQRVSEEGGRYECQAAKSGAADRPRHDRQAGVPDLCVTRLRRWLPRGGLGRGGSPASRRTSDRGSRAVAVAPKGPGEADQEAWYVFCQRTALVSGSRGLALSLLPIST
jgi:hypothetical protein